MVTLDDMFLALKQSQEIARLAGDYAFEEAEKGRALAQAVEAAASDDPTYDISIFKLLDRDSHYKQRHYYPFVYEISQVVVKPEDTGLLYGPIASLDPEGMLIGDNHRMLLEDPNPLFRRKHLRKLLTSE